MPELDSRKPNAYAVVWMVAAVVWMVAVAAGATCLTLFLFKALYFPIPLGPMNVFAYFSWMLIAVPLFFLPALVGVAVGWSGAYAYFGHRHPAFVGEVSMIATVVVFAGSGALQDTTAGLSLMSLLAIDVQQLYRLLFMIGAVWISRDVAIGMVGITRYCETCRCRMRTLTRTSPTHHEAVLIPLLESRRYGLAFAKATSSKPKRTEGRANLTLDWCAQCFGGYVKLEVREFPAAARRSTSLVVRTAYASEVTRQESNAILDVVEIDRQTTA